MDRLYSAKEVHAQLREMGSNCSLDWVRANCQALGGVVIGGRKFWPEDWVERVFSAPKAERGDRENWSHARKQQARSVPEVPAGRLKIVACK